MRIGLIPNVGIAQILVPTDEGEFAARGLNVSIQPVTDTTQTMISVAGGQFDIGGVSMGPATLNAFNRGADLKIIASVFAEPPGTRFALSGDRPHRAHRLRRSQDRPGPEGAQGRAQWQGDWHRVHPGQSTPWPKYTLNVRGARYTRHSTS